MFNLWFLVISLDNIIAFHVLISVSDQAVPIQILLTFTLAMC